MCATLQLPRYFQCAGFQYYICQYPFPAPCLHLEVYCFYVSYMPYHKFQDVLVLEPFIFTAALLLFQVLTPRSLASAYGRRTFTHAHTTLTVPTAPSAWGWDEAGRSTASWCQMKGEWVNQHPHPRAQNTATPQLREVWVRIIIYRPTKMASSLQTIFYICYVRTVSVSEGNLCRYVFEITVPSFGKCLLENDRNIW